jgi:hypothetical protein
MGKMILLMRKAWVEGEHPRDGAGRFALAPDTGMNPPRENGRATEKEDAQRKADMKMLSSVLETGKSEYVYSESVNGRVEIEKGYFTGDRTTTKGKFAKGEGLKHIVESRLDDGMDKKNIPALLLAIIDVVRRGKDITPEIDKNRGYLKFEKDGIIALLSRKRGNQQTAEWLLTGFVDNENEAKATDTIQTVIARYGYTPEYSLLRNQVGAVAASLQSSSDSLEKSIARLKFQIARWELEQALRRLGVER